MCLEEDKDAAVTSKSMGLLGDGGKWVSSPHHPLLGTAGGSLFPYVSFQLTAPTRSDFFPLSHSLNHCVILTLVSFSIFVKFSSPISFYTFFPTRTSFLCLFSCLFFS